MTRPSTRFSRRHALAAAIALSALALGGPAAAQTYPAKPITFIVPFAAWVVLVVISTV